MAMLADFDSLKIVGKYAVIVLCLLLIVYGLAKMTPWLAAKIDNRRKNPERVKKDGFYDFEKDDVKSVYDPQTEDIKKNEDGVDSDNGKE